MLTGESQTEEYKSIKKIRDGGDKGIADLARTCVCLANANGGRIYIGIEDKIKNPPADQKITIEEVNKALNQLRSLTFNVSLIPSGIQIAPNGGDFFYFEVPSSNGIAATSDGRYYIRIGDECQAIKPEEIIHLAAEKGAFNWELVVQPYTIEALHPEQIQKFIGLIKKSPQVRDSVKNKSEQEILEHYHLLQDGKATNLGVLWIGTATQRNKIFYPITVQYIVYNEREDKIRKLYWYDQDLNPLELLEDIEKEATELQYYQEAPDGLFRTQIRHYPNKSPILATVTN